MDIGQELDALRDALPDCRLAAYVDLEAELVLISSAHDKPRQEALDALAQFGAQALSGRLPGVAGAENAVLLGPAELTVVLRSPAEPGEAVCCKCTAGADADAVLDRMRLSLTRIAAGA